MTVDRKLAFLAGSARKIHQRFLDEQLRENGPVTEVQFDELETIEHTNCKPVSVPLVVQSPSRLILGIGACSMPAQGLLAAISRKKYGRRLDQRRETLMKLMNSLAPYLDEKVKVRSDSHPFYPGIVKR